MAQDSGGRARSGTLGLVEEELENGTTGMGMLDAGTLARLLLPE